MIVADFRLNPSTEEVISLMPDGTVEDAKKAIDAAEKAQDQWERTPSIERAAYLTKIAAGIRKREKELTDIIVREGGKTQGLANVEVLFTADYIDLKSATPFPKCYLHKEKWTFDS